MLRQHRSTVVLISAFFCGAVLLKSAFFCSAVSAETNLALGKRCSFDPKPNYKYCTDRGDPIQLTDGKKYGSSWTKTSTVGWARTGVAEIIVDLGRSATIETVRVYSVGGGRADMEYPEYIAVLVSDDGVRYGFAGLIGSESLPSEAGKKISHTFVLDDLRISARYVKLVVRPYGAYTRFFTDEVEIIAVGDKSRTRVITAAELPKVKSSETLMHSIDDYLQHKRNVNETRRVFRELKTDARSKLGSDLAEELRLLAEQVSSPRILLDSQNARRARERLNAVRARIYKQLYSEPFVCYSANPMDMLFEEDMPVVEISGRRSITVRMWRNEYESAAVNVINCSQSPLRLSVSVSPLRGNDVVSNDKVFTIRRSVFVKVKGHRSIGDALVLQEDKPFTLAPGQLTQIWLSIHSAKLKPGKFKGAISVTGVTDGRRLPIQTLPIELTVDELVFPSEVALNTCVWDEYITSSRSPFRQDISKVSEDLRTHYTNVGVIHPAYLPWPKKSGRNISALDFTSLDRELAVRDFVRTYLLYFGWERRNEKNDFGPWMSTKWKLNFRTWLRSLVYHLRKRGIGYQRFALYPYDERLGDEFYQVAKVIKQIDPKIRIYANWFGDGPSDFMRFEKLIDIWCLQAPKAQRNPRWFATIKGFDSATWSYGVSRKTWKGFSAKTNPPYAYYRFLPWYAIENDISGAGFWVYVSWSLDQWHDALDLKSHYSVVYNGKQAPADSVRDTVVVSRRWEAWREGIEDYQYVYELKKQIESRRKTHPELAALAEKLLSEATDKILRNPEDANVVYDVRSLLSQALMDLLGASDVGYSR